MPPEEELEEGTAEEETAEEEVDLTEEEASEEEAAEEEAEVFELNHRGNTVKVDYDKLVNLAQQGFDYSDRMRALNEKEQSMAGYAAMNQILEQRPELAQKIRDLIAGKTPTKTGDDSEELELDGLDLMDDDAPEATGAAKELAALKAQVQELTKEREVARQHEHDRQMEQAIRDEVKKYPALDEAGEIAFAPILGLLTVRPGAQVEDVVRVVAEQFATYQQQIRSSYVEKKDKPKAPVPRKPGPSPTVLQPPKLSGRDLESGDVRRQALAWLDKQASE